MNIEIITILMIIYYYYGCIVINNIDNMTIWTILFDFDFQSDLNRIETKLKICSYQSSVLPVQEYIFMCKKILFDRKISDSKQ